MANNEELRRKEIYRNILGNADPDSPEGLLKQALAYRDIGEHKQALKLFEKLYALRCKVLGEEHPDTLTTLNNLAFTYGKLGDRKRASELAEKAADLRRL